MRAAVLCLLALLVAGRASSATHVTEQAFLDSVSKDQRVRAILAEPLALAQAERARAKLNNPEIAFDREALRDAPRQDTWSLSWAPPIDGRNWIQSRAGQAHLAAAESRQAISRVALRNELRATFADWSLSRQGAVFARQLADVVARLARQSEAQSARGEAPRLTARRLSLARMEVRAEAARWSADLARMHGQVRVWLPGLSAEDEPIRPPLPPVPTDTSLWSRSPRVAELEQQIREAEARDALAGRFWALPELTIGRQTARGDLVDLEGPVYGIRWGLPIFDRRQSDRIVSRGRLSAARARLDIERTRTREEFAAALAAYVSLRGSAEVAADAVIDAERVVTSATAMYEAGESDITDLLESLRGALSGRLAGLDAYRAALRAHRELEIAAGQPLPLTEGDER